jgi:hypothetical protein
LIGRLVSCRRIDTFTRPSGGLEVGPISVGRFGYGSWVMTGEPTRQLMALALALVLVLVLGTLPT